MNYFIVIILNQKNIRIKRKLNLFLISFFFFLFGLLEFEKNYLITKILSLILMILIINLLYILNESHIAHKKNLIVTDNNITLNYKNIKNQIILNKKMVIMNNILFIKIK